MMVTKVLIKRRFKKDKTKEIVALLNKFRTTAMDCAGYISGETLISNDDPQKMVVISTWGEYRGLEPLEKQRYPKKQPSHAGNLSGRPHRI
jgi:quinol monooxygenase YgiN